MELEVSELIGGQRGERWPQDPGNASQRLLGSPLGHQGRGDRAADLEDHQGSYFPSILESRWPS